MIRRTGSLVLAVALMAGCTGSDPSRSATSAAPSSLTVTTTVTAAPSTSARPAGPAAAGVPRCDAPALAVSVMDAQGAAGSTYRTLVFRNGGEQPCFLRGYPGVSAADAAGKAAVDAARDGSRAVRVVLEPGRAAHAQLAMRNIPSDAKACPTYPTLLVTPPDSRRTQTVTVDVSMCAGDMRVSVVQPGEG